jgi:HD-like signal output (HDOD) protein
MPAVAVEILGMLEDPDFAYEDLATALSVDPGAAADILRLTNSPLFGVAGEVSKLHQALTLLGPRRTRSFILGRYLVESIGRYTPPNLDISYFWRRSLMRAVLATRLADDIIPRQREEVFMAALLADVGIPILAEAFVDVYGAVVAQYGPGGRFTESLESETVGATHCQTGAAVLRFWGLPEFLCNAVLHHHDDRKESEDPEILSGRLINAADQIASLLCEFPNDDEVFETLVRASALINKDIVFVAEKLQHFDAELSELADLLHLDVISSDLCSQVIELVTSRTQ